MNEPEIIEWHRDPFLISTDPDLLDIDVVHNYLSQQSYWSRDIPRATVEKSIMESLCFGLYLGTGQIGFGRVVSDYATVAYLGDIFIVERYRRRGLSKWLMECIKSHPSLQGLRRWILATRDAHGLYERFGYTPLKSPGNFMELHQPDIYKNN